MSRFLQICLLAILVAAPNWANAQEMRIFTLTKDVTQPDTPANRAPIVSRSLTLIHSGKVYDYISELREVTIYEPTHRRFVVLNEAAAAYAIISQDEVRRFLTLAEDRARELAGDLIRSDDANLLQGVEFLQFQLRPEFRTNFDPATRRLQLDSPHLKYDLECVAAPQPAIAEAYLRYTDAMAEFNSVLHPQSFLPAPRLWLNRTLREQQMLPLTVRRKVQLEQSLELLAEHEWKWSLTEHDRQLITRWESQITKRQLKELPFEQLQRAVLSGKVSLRETPRRAVR